ncbi:MAG TPA: hypothetical protein VGF47_09265 [Solirubrobacteraceae bacterium]|jgi:hypothetical protein
MHRIRRRLSYANVVATLALLFAMSGGALAANHYLVNSTKQINPKVLKKLRGVRGARGSTGQAGPTGAQGAKGVAGPKGSDGAKGDHGDRGEQGKPGDPGLSALSDLPSGDSESGTWGLSTVGGKAGETMETSASFPIPLEEGAPSGQVITTEVKAPVTHCSGPGHADKGFLCIYINKEFFLDPSTKKVFNPEIFPAPGGSGRFGFMMAWTTTSGNPGAFGTYTVTAG